LDGRFDDWPASADVRSDEEYLYARVSLQEPVALQRMNWTLAWLLDLDVSAQTGRRVKLPRAPGWLGVDLEVRFSPPGEGGRRPGPGGVRVFAYTEQGAKPLSHRDVGLLAAPVGASLWHEMRISRRLAALGLPEPGVDGGGEVRGALTLVDPNGTPLKWGRPFRFEPLNSLSPAHDDRLPPRDQARLRLLSYRISPRLIDQDAQTLARLIRALQPDAVLLQGWPGAQVEAVEAWFRRWIGETPPWRATTDPEQGLAIVTWYPLRSIPIERHAADRPAAPDTNEAQSADAQDEDTENDAAQPEGAATQSRQAEPLWPFVAGRVFTPIGRLALVSVQLRCCGGPQSPQEWLRRRQARRLRSTLAPGLERMGHPPLLIGGTLNPVGGDEPLQILVQGADVDGSDLTAAPAHVLGEGGFYTYGQRHSPFTPARMDYVLYPDAAYRVASAFVLDTTLLSNQSLQAFGLRRQDTELSDHLPLVVDLDAARPSASASATGSTRSADAASPSGGPRR
jgi:hypothetical protein